MQEPKDNFTLLSVIVPCFNEVNTLKKCIERVLNIADGTLKLEIIIVDDFSIDDSLTVANELEKNYPEIRVLKHETNQGKGAALRTGFHAATGDFVAIQDADLEYNPLDLKKLLGPLIKNEADVVFGSRFSFSGAHRVLYFWHYLGNRFLTLLSNMFSDLNLTDMETCYKVFRKDIIQNIDIKENRFGFEPEIVAKIAHMRLRIFEMGISYYGRTYEEGKKIKAKDGFRALYCIFRYNAHKAPIPVQFIIYLFIGGLAAVINFLGFIVLYNIGMSVTISTLTAFFTAAIVNYFLCISLLFRHKVKWKTIVEVLIYCLIVVILAIFDFKITKLLIDSGAQPAVSKLVATGVAFVFNFMGRRFFVFPEKSSGPWRPQKSFPTKKRKLS